MAEDFPFVRGELLNKLQKFTYHKQVKGLIMSIDRQLAEVKDQLEMYPSEEKYLLSQKDKVVHQGDLVRHRVLKRQRDRMQNKLMELEKSIREDIQSSDK